jgi:hypothetical protein
MAMFWLLLLCVAQVEKPLLQSVAWLWMAVDYSVEEGSVSKGLQQTFSGQKPCGLCVALKDQNAQRSPVSETSHKTSFETSEDRSWSVPLPKGLWFSSSMVSSYLYQGRWPSDEMVHQWLSDAPQPIPILGA